MRNKQNNETTTKSQHHRKDYRTLRAELDVAETIKAIAISEERNIEVITNRFLRQQIDIYNATKSHS